MEEASIGLWAGVLGGLAVALVTHILESMRLERRARRETVSLLMSLEWELEQAKLSIGSDNTLLPVLLPSFDRLSDRALIGRLPRPLVVTVQAVQTLLSTGNQQVTAMLKGSTLAIDAGMAPTRVWLSGIKGAADHYFNGALPYMARAQRLLLPFTRRGCRLLAVRLVWWHFGFWLGERLEEEQR